jgi:hypothetical protein
VLSLEYSLSLPLIWVCPWTDYTKLVHTHSLGFDTLGILWGESYNVICAVEDLIRVMLKYPTTPTKSRLDLGFEAQPRKRPWLCLLVLATMWPALDPAGHRVPQTKPTYLLHTWRPHRHRPFVFVLHLHLHQLSRNLHLQYLAKSQSTQRCQSLITPGRYHPLILEPHRSSIRSSESFLQKSWWR